MANDCDEELPRYTTVERLIEDQGSDFHYGVLDREEPEIAWFGMASDDLVKRWEAWLNSGEKSRDGLSWDTDEART
jgi:hypothetical protein